jgi:UDP-N-acetylmuramate dehydrogenase
MTPLAPLTTLRVGGAAARFVRAEGEEAIASAVREADARGEPVFVLGGGSNVVIADGGFSGTVVHVASRGIDERQEDGHVVVDAAAGEPWDAFVARAVASGLSGVECLAGIPGLLGATPIQNVGAYGQDVSETIVRVRVWDRALAGFAELAPTACGFGYRTSAFKADPRHVVVGVTFRLERTAFAQPIRYAELARALGVAEGARPKAADVARTVVTLRRAKGMVLDPADPDTRSAGSFFVNPVVSTDEARAVEARAWSSGVLPAGDALPRFGAAEGRVKIPAAWLIERAGFAKGTRRGKVGVSSKHALALTTEAGATAAELLAFAGAVEDAVRMRFGVALAREPVVVGT